MFVIIIIVAPVQHLSFIDFIRHSVGATYYSKFKLLLLCNGNLLSHYWHEIADFMPSSAYIHPSWTFITLLHYPI